MKETIGEKTVLKMGVGRGGKACRRTQDRLNLLYKKERGVDGEAAGR